MSTRQKIRAKTPRGVALFRDEHGVPCIQSDHLDGVAWGMGYMHARDRGMQLLLMRLLGQGRVAECLDDSDESVEIDTFFRKMNWAGETEAEVDALDDATRAWCQAYCDGVNACLSKRRPWEFRLVGYTPEPWTIADSVQISRMIGYLTLAQSQGEVERLLVELAQTALDDARIEALFPGAVSGLAPGVDRALLREVTLGERVVPDSVRWSGAAPRMMASNNWVIAASRSASGAPIMANDPHLEVNRLPNVWCEQSLSWDEGAFTGMTMPGLPAALIGRTEALSWGATYTFMDAVDSWIEDCAGGAARREGPEGTTWAPFTARREMIQRKKHEPVEVVFHENEHGVLDGDPHEPGKYLATRWASSRSGAWSLTAAREILLAQTVEEGMAALGKIETAWSWVFADRDGHIGFQMSGLMPRRPEGVSGLTPLPGWDATYDWDGFVPHDELPRAVDPPEGYLVTANHDLNHLGEASPINMPMGDYRARRIAALLEASEAHTVESCRQIQMDVRSIQADDFLAVLLPLLPEDDMHARILRRWDRRYDPTSLGATLFEAFYSALRREVFADGLGGEVVDHLAHDTGVFIDFYQNLDRVMLDADSPWYGDRAQAECFRAAFAQATEAPVVTWDTVNRFEMTQIFFGGKLPGALGFDVGPLAMRGGRATPHQGQIYTSAGRLTSFAPSVRLVADMAEDMLHTSIAGGPSDRRASSWYRSGVEDWCAGVLKEMPLLSPTPPAGRLRDRKPRW